MANIFATSGRTAQQGSLNGRRPCRSFGRFSISPSTCQYFRHITANISAKSGRMAQQGNHSHTAQQGSHSEEEVLKWTHAHNDEEYGVLDCSEDALLKLKAAFSLCVTGPAMSVIRKHYNKAEASRLVAATTVFARMSPDDKELIVKWMKDLGMYTLMCGDGTNDVGALKQAHVGVALLGGNETVRAAPGVKKAKGRSREDRQREDFQQQMEKMLNEGEAPT
eukprot:g15307.t1